MKAGKLRPQEWQRLLEELEYWKGREERWKKRFWLYVVLWLCMMVAHAVHTPPDGLWAGALWLSVTAVLGAEAWYGWKRQRLLRRIYGVLAEVKEKDGT